MSLRIETIEHALKVELSDKELKMVMVVITLEKSKHRVRKRVEKLQGSPNLAK